MYRVTYDIALHASQLCLPPMIRLLITERDVSRVVIIMDRLLSDHAAGAQREGIIAVFSDVPQADRTFARALSILVVQCIKNRPRCATISVEDLNTAFQQVIARITLCWLRFVTKDASRAIMHDHESLIAHDIGRGPIETIDLPCADPALDAKLASSGIDAELVWWLTGCRCNAASSLLKHALAAKTGRSADISSRFYYTTPLVRRLGADTIAAIMPRSEFVDKLANVCILYTGVAVTSLNANQLNRLAIAQLSTLYTNLYNLNTRRHDA